MIRRLLVALWATLFTAGVSLAQPGGSITGTVKDETGSALPGALVSLSGPTTRAVTADNTGAYRFDQLPPGTYRVTARLAGFGAVEKPDVHVVAGGSAEAAFTLGVALRGEEVVVTASKVESAMVDAPSTMSVISNETIQTSPATNMGDLLRSVPGLNVIQTSARDINLTSRQPTQTLSSSQLALLDGRSIYLDFFGLILWDMVPTNSSEIKQIEVVRGPASAVWGANALAGVINIITKSPREAPGTNVTLSAGTFDRECDNCSRTGSGKAYGGSFSYAQAPNDAWSYRLSAGYFNSDPYSRPTGNLPIVDDPRLPGVKVGGAPYPVDAPVGGGIPFGAAFQNTGTSQPKGDIRVDQELGGGGRITYSAGLSGTEGIIHTGIGPFDIQKGSIMGYGRVSYNKGGFKLSAFTNVTDVDAPNLLAFDPVTRGPVQLDFNTQTYDLEVGHSRIFAERHVVTFGGNARRNNFDITLAPRSKDRNEFGAYVQDEIFFDSFRLALGGRVDKFGNLDDPIFSPRVTAMYKPTKAHSIRASFNKAFRSPSTISNYLDQSIVQPADLSGLRDALPPSLQPLVAQPFPLVVFAVGSEIPIGGRPQPPLREESVTAYELAYTGTFNARTTVGIALFINDQHDNINFSRVLASDDPYTSRNPPPGWRLPPSVLDDLLRIGRPLPRTAFTYVNLGPLRHRGVEVSIDHAFSREWSAFANYSYEDDPEILNNEDGPEYALGELSLPPRNRFNLGLNWNNRRFVGSASLNHSDKAFWTDVLNEPYFGYSKAFDMVNASFGVKWARGKVVTTLKGTNLANEKIQQHVFGDILKRSLMAEVRLSF